jgi:hypothetical protein
LAGSFQGGYPAAFGNKINGIAALSITWGKLFRKADSSSDCRRSYGFQALKYFDDEEV